MNSLLLKKELILEIKKILSAKENHLKSAVYDAQKAANDYGPPKDRYDSFRTQLLRKRDMLAQQLQVTIEELNTIEKIDSDFTSNMVEFGAIVITNVRNFFIAVSAGKLMIENKEYYAVSVQVPIYKAMQSKKSNQEFVFNGIKYHIENII